MIYVFTTFLEPTTHGHHRFSCIWEGLLALLITIAIYYAQPGLVERLQSQPSIQYYCVAIIATLLFSVELFKQDNSLIIGVLIAAGVMTISLYTGNPTITYLSLFLNLFIIARIISSLVQNKNCQSNQNWNGI